MGKKVDQKEYSRTLTRQWKKIVHKYDTLGNLICLHIGHTGKVLGFTVNYQQFYLL
jgi:hypothetical protein